MNKSNFYFTFAMNIMPATLLTVLPIGGLLLKNGTLTPEKFVLIVILDEATANVDPENEKELMEAVSELTQTQKKTVIMIAHRLKTVRHADQIFVVDKGQIVQRGTHDELMAQDGIYRHFISGREQAVGWKL